MSPPPQSLKSQSLQKARTDFLTNFMLQIVKITVYWDGYRLIDIDMVPLSTKTYTQGKMLSRLCLLGYDKRSKTFKVYWISQYYEVSIFTIWVGPSGSNYWISFTPVFSWVLIFVHLLFISRCVFTWRGYIDDLGNFHANQTSICLDPHQK